MILERYSYASDGIFGRLLEDDEKFFSYTLEHSYLTDPVLAARKPKIPPGTYECIKGSHILPGMEHDFQTYEITGVQGHTGLLFHPGNYNEDSDGCVLLGADVLYSKPKDSRWINLSEVTFNKFISSLAGIDSFTLTVK